MKRFGNSLWDPRKVILLDLVFSFLITNELPAAPASDRVLHLSYLVPFKLLNLFGVYVLKQSGPTPHPSRIGQMDLREMPPKQLSGNKATGPVMSLLEIFPMQNIFLDPRLHRNIFYEKTLSQFLLTHKMKIP